MNSTISRHQRPPSGYDEAWRRKPMNHISHLSFNSLQFALCLREDTTTKKSIFSGDSGDNTLQEHDIPKSNCPKPACQSCQEEIFIQSDKKMTLLKKLDRISRELEKITSILAEIEEKDREVILEHTSLDHELSKLRAVKNESNLSEKLSSIRGESLELKRQIDLRSIELSRLKSRQQNFLPSPTMAMSQSLPLFATSDTFLHTSSFHPLRRSTLERRIHTGVYKRSASTNWELAWSCCLNPSKEATGCSIQSSVSRRQRMGHTLSQDLQKRPKSATLKYL